MSKISWLMSVLDNVVLKILCDELSISIRNSLVLNFKKQQNEELL